MKKSDLNWFPVKVDTIVKDSPQDEIQSGLIKGTEELKKALAEPNDLKAGKHINQKMRVLKKYKKYKTIGRPKRGYCSKYDSERDSQYELFMTYYKLVEQIMGIEKRQYEKTPNRGKKLKEGINKDCLGVVQYAYWRWVDVGTPSISGYTRGRELVKYSTLFLTLIANGFKLALARMGGRASFIGTALQGLAHLSFTLYFIFLTQDDKALAIPKIVGLIISIVSCVWIADAGNGFL